jgi:lipopolysaccharide transport system permease protein
MESVTGLQADVAPAVVPPQAPAPTAPAGDDDDMALPESSAFREIVDDYRHHADLLVQLTLRDVRLRYKEAVMGFGWAILMPVLVVLAGLVVRYAMAYYAGESLNRDAVASVAVKALPWAFFVGTIGFATTSLVGNMNLVSKIYFPREVLPISATLAQVVDSLVGSTALLVVLLAIGVYPTATWLWVPLLAALVLVFTAAAALFLSCANLFFRDVKYIVQVLVTFGIFFTPVLFDAGTFGALGAKIVMLNPMAPLLEGMRLSVVANHNLLEPLIQMSTRGDAVLAWSPWYLAYSAAWAILGFIGASLLFHRLEFVFAEYV